MLTLVRKGRKQLFFSVPKASRKGWVLGEQTRYKLKVRLGFHRNDSLVFKDGFKEQPCAAFALNCL